MLICAEYFNKTIDEGWKFQLKMSIYRAHEDPIDRTSTETDSKKGQERMKTLGWLMRRKIDEKLPRMQKKFPKIFSTKTNR